MKKILVITAVAAFAASFAVTNAYAAGFIKIDGIEGEAAKSALPTAKRQHKPFTVVKPMDRSRMGGVHVAAGDVNGDGRAAKAHGRVRGGLNPADTVQAPQKEQRAEKGHARVRGGLNPANEVQAPQAEQRAEKGHARVRGGLNPATDVQAPKDDSEIGLLLPAVQKAR